MTIEEKIQKLEKNKNKRYLFYSPRVVTDGAKLVYDYESLELYENMEKNTLKFAEKEIVNLIASANISDSEVKKDLRLNLIFNGDFSNLSHEPHEPIDFILANKERFIAVYQYVKEEKEEEFYLGFTKVDRSNSGDYVYLNLAKLFELFDSNNIKYSINLKIDERTKCDLETKFTISYNPVKNKVLKKVK